MCSRVTDFDMTLREYIIFWQETYDKHQSRQTTYDPQ